MKVEIKGGIYKKSASASYDKGKLSFYPGTGFSFADEIFLHPHTIDIEIPDFDTTEIEVAALKEALAKEKADHSVKIMAIENAISELLCIEG